MKRTVPLDEQVKEKTQRKTEEKTELDGNFSHVISTGSTLLDLAISGGRVHGGGIPSGIFVEIFGPSGSGKSILLCEIAGNVHRQGGEIMFFDPEARIDPSFASMFGYKVTEENYFTPDTIPEVFAPVRKWEPKPEGKVHGIFADSLAALSTDLEMETDEGDKMGGRRAKEFSEQLRRTCRELPKKNYLMVCSNQIREIMDAPKYSAKYASPGGKAMEHYPSLRLRTSVIKKYSVEATINKKEISKIVGVRTEVFVFKSSVWKPYESAPVTILFDYGLDNVRENIQFLKDYGGYSTYATKGQALDKSMNKAIQIIEENNMENILREEVIDLWEEIEAKFKTERKPKR